MAPALPVTGDDADKADGGNGVTIGRIARIVSEETGLASRLRLPCDLPIDKADDFESFLAAADIALLCAGITSARWSCGGWKQRNKGRHGSRRHRRQRGRGERR